MAATTKDKAGKVVILPYGEWKYVHLDRPDREYQKYSVNPVFYGEAAVTVREIFEEFAEENFVPKVVKSSTFLRGYKVLDDGGISVNAKSNYAVPIFDAKGREMAPDTAVASGTMGRVKVKLDISGNSSKPGVIARLNGAQVGILKEYSRSGGFGSIADELGEDAHVASDDEVEKAKASYEARRNTTDTKAPAKGAPQGDQDGPAVDDDAADF